MKEKVDSKEKKKIQSSVTTRSKSAAKGAKAAQGTQVVKVEDVSNIPKLPKSSAFNLQPEDMRGVENTEVDPD